MHGRLTRSHRRAIRRDGADRGRNAEPDQPAFKNPAEGKKLHRWFVTSAAQTGRLTLCGLLGDGAMIAPEPNGERRMSHQPRPSSRRYHRDGCLSPLPAFSAGEAAGFLAGLEAMEAADGGNCRSRATRSRISSIPGWPIWVRRPEILDAGGECDRAGYPAVGRVFRQEFA
jgi:hypothetical protein